MTGMERESDLRTADRYTLIAIIIRQQAIIEGLKSGLPSWKGGPNPKAQAGCPV